MKAPKALITAALILAVSGAGSVSYGRGNNHGGGNNNHGGGHNDNHGGGNGNGHGGGNDNSDHGGGNNDDQNGGGSDSADEGEGSEAGSGEVSGGGYDELPDSITITAVIRDFRAAEQSGGHPDFQAFAGSTTVGLVADTLGADGTPVAADLRGQLIEEEYRDAEGRYINPALFESSRGDAAGDLSPGGSGNGLTSVESFEQWYQNVPGVNTSKAIPLTLTRVSGTDRYVFDSDTDAPYDSIGGFFPIDDDLYGNYASGHNYHFTTEVRTSFTYSTGAGQVFQFTGDDDVWVFINGRLVIDLGGLHPKKEQFLELDRLDWLENGEQCTLDVFHAERRTTESNFRMETTIRFRDANLPNTMALCD